MSGSETKSGASGSTESGSFLRDDVGLRSVSCPTPSVVHRARHVQYYQSSESGKMDGGMPWSSSVNRFDAGDAAAHERDTGIFSDGEETEHDSSQNHSFDGNEENQGVNKMIENAEGARKNDSAERFHRNRLSTLTTSLGAARQIQEPDVDREDNMSLESRDILEVGSLEGNMNDGNYDDQIWADTHAIQAAIEEERTVAQDEYIDECISSESSIGEKEESSQARNNPALGFGRSAPSGPDDSQTFSFQAETVEEVLARERELSPLRKQYRSSLYNRRSFQDLPGLERDRLSLSDFVPAVSIDFYGGRGDAPAASAVENAFSVLESAGVEPDVLHFLIHQVYSFYMQRVEAAEDTMGENGDSVAHMTPLERRIVSQVTPDTTETQSKETSEMAAKVTNLAARTASELREIVKLLGLTSRGKRVELTQRSNFPFSPVDFELLLKACHLGQDLNTRALSRESCRRILRKPRVNRIYLKNGLDARHLRWKFSK